MGLRVLLHVCVRGEDVLEIDKSRHVHVDENKWNVRLEVRLELCVVFELSNTGRKKLGFASMGICDYNERNRSKKVKKKK